MAVFAALGVIAAAAAPSAHARAGDLDRSFSGDGRVALQAAGAFVARDVAVQGDGRIVVAGSSCTPHPGSKDGTCLQDGGASFRLARLTADGGLDPEFGDRGLVTTPVGTGRSQAFAVLVLPSGAIVAGGVARDAAGRDGFALVRYSASGRVESARVHALGRGFAAIGALAHAPDGRIVAAGQVDGRFAVARFTPAGELDGAFGAGGTAIAGPAYGFGMGVGAAADGGILAAGIAGGSPDPAGHRFGLLRLGAAGRPDTGFAGGGFAQPRPGSASSFANAATVAADGRWTAAGAAIGDGGRQVMALVGGGRRGVEWTSLIDAGHGAVAADVESLEDGRAVAIGHSVPAGGGSVFATARVRTDDGARDPRFGDGGVATVRWERYPYARATAGALLPDGRLLSAGIGCADGGTGPRCQGGVAVLLLARQLGDAVARRPAARLSLVPRRVRRPVLQRRGLPLRVRADQRVRMVARLTGRGAGGRRLTLVRVERRRLERSRALRLRPPSRRMRSLRGRTLLLEIRIADGDGNSAWLRRRVALR